MSLDINIFMPTYHRFEMTKRSIESIVPHVKSSVYNTKLIICDNNSPEEMKDWLRSLANDKIVVCLNKQNAGKAKLVNEVYKVYSDCSHFMSIDSDMIAEEKGNFIDEMVWCIEHFYEFGLLSSFQKENDQQIWKGLTKKCEKAPHEVSYGKYNSVAGGCIILRKEFWDAVGHYDTYGGVYGFDDGLLMQSVYQKGKLVGVIDTIKLTHPIDDDKGYKNWKTKNIAKRCGQGYYDKS